LEVLKDGLNYLSQRGDYLCIGGFKDMSFREVNDDNFSDYVGF